MIGEAQTFPLTIGGAFVKMRSMVPLSECPFTASGRFCNAVLNDGSSPRMSRMVGVMSTSDASQIDVNSEVAPVGWTA